MNPFALSSGRTATTRFAWLIVAVVLTILPAPASFSMGNAGHRPPGEERTTSGAQASADRKTTMVRDIQQDPRTFAEAPVLLEGFFRGWSGPCAGSPPQTRSDWMFEDGSGCIYVTGMLPSGLSAVAPQGERIILDAIVKIGKGGTPYLSARSVKVMPPPSPKE